MFLQEGSLPKFLHEICMEWFLGRSMAKINGSNRTSDP